MQTTPLEVLEGLIGCAIMNPGRSYRGVPGELVSRLPPDARVLLSGLKSDDIKTLQREYVWGGKADDDRKRLRDRLLEFDRKVLRL